MAVSLVLVWSSSLQVKVMSQNSKLGQLEASYNSRTNNYQNILKDKKKLSESQDKLIALNKLATNRFLNANMLDALQHTTVDGIQLTRFRLEQSFEKTPEVKGKSSKPATSTQKMMLVLDARDSSLNPGGDQVNRFKEAIAQNAYFKASNFSTNAIRLKNLSTPQMDSETGKPFVQFSFECQYPEKVR